MRTQVHQVRLSVLICLFAFFSLQTSSQSISTNNRKFELGLGLGPMFFVGDLGGSAGVGKTFIKDLDLPLTKFSKGVYLTYSPTEFLGIRAGINLGYLEGDDLEAPSKGGAEMDRRERGLNFKTQISEAYGVIEFYPTVFFEKYDGLKGKIRPYFTAGAGLFHFNPQAQDVDGKWVKTHTLRLEGQGMAEYPKNKPYSLTQKNLLAGFGVKYYLSDNLFTGFEVMHRKLFTDYVDDVSLNYYIDPIYFDQYLSAADAEVARRIFYKGSYTFPTTRPYEEYAERGDPSQNDAYFSVILKLGWRLGNPDPRGKQLKCPVFY